MEKQALFYIRVLTGVRCELPFWFYDFVFAEVPDIVLDAKKLSSLRSRETFSELNY
jgi:hypothetical protein